MNRIDSKELDLMVNWMTNTTLNGRPKLDTGPGKTVIVHIDHPSMTEHGKALALRALQAWTEMIGIRFEPGSYKDALIRFHESDDPDLHGIIKGHDNRIYIGAQHIEDSKGNVNHYVFQTFLHEIGHALGLGHSRHYNPDNNDPIDSYQNTVMSYSGQLRKNEIYTSNATPVTPQIADIIAVHELYDTPGLRTGDTVYGIGTNLNSESDGHLKQILTIMTEPLTYPFEEDTFLKEQKEKRITFTILDNGGTDTIDFSNDRLNQKVNLNPEWASDVYGFHGNMIIARDTIIENYIAGSGWDLIIGNNADNTLEGRKGDDTLEGGPGADTLDGGPGQDTVSYESSSAGVLVRLHDARAVRFGDAEGDTLIDFEHLTGSAHNDILAGDGGDNILHGLAGDDTLYGGPPDGTGSRNNDHLHGGPGDDRLFGGQGHDRLYGGEGNDVLRGGPGQDWLYADGNAMDVLNGGPGRDVFVFYPSNLGGGTIQDFTDGEDAIKLGEFRSDGYESIADLDITPIGDNVHIELAGEDYLTLIILSDFDANNLDESDFSFIA